MFGMLLMYMFLVLSSCLHLETSCSTYEMVVDCSKLRCLGDSGNVWILRTNQFSTSSSQDVTHTRQVSPVRKDILASNSCTHQTIRGQRTRPKLVTFQWCPWLKPSPPHKHESFGSPHRVAILFPDRELGGDKGNK